MITDLLKKYESYQSNIQWHVDTNKPTGEELLKCEIRVNDYHELIADLKSVIIKECQDLETKIIILRSLIENKKG